MSKLKYIANSRIPTEKAHGIQIMKMCEAFADQGMDVELVLPRRLNPIKDNPFEYYNIEKKFKITKLPTIDCMPFAGPFKWLAYWVNYTIFSVIAFCYCPFRSSDVYYGRDVLPLFFLSSGKKNVFWEIHKLSNNFLKKSLIRLLSKFADGVVSTNEWKLEKLKDMGIIFGKQLAVPNGVDVSNFDIPITKENARKEIGFPNNKKNVLYTGHLYEWKGVDVLADAAKLLPEEYLVIFVGGTDDDVKSFRKNYAKTDTIKVTGRVPHEDIPVYLKSADVLVLPNTPKTEESKFQTSPLKLFEYMASDRPIIASDLPSIKEILSEETAFFVNPGNPAELARTIKKVLESRGGTSQVSQNALQEITKYTWDKRAEKIIKWMS
jgi:glycosyltransferase involved in cell wall biosynthesis